MTTPEKIASNAENALKSTGPQTPQGKAISSKNAMKHGLLSKAILLPNESADWFYEFVGAWREELRPVGLVQEMYFQEFVFYAWRRCRPAEMEADIFSHHLHAESVERAETKVRSYEKTSFQTELERGVAITDKEKHSQALAEAQEARDRGEKCPTLGSAFLRDAKSSNALSKLRRYETTIERRMDRALRELKRLQAARLDLNAPVPLATDETVACAHPVNGTGAPAGGEA